MLKKIFMGICCFMLALTSSGCDKIPTIKQTTGDYVLNISVSAATFNEGEDIEVTIVFENNSGTEQKIFRNASLISLSFVNNEQYNDVYGFVTIQDVLVKGIVTSIKNIGSQLPKGRYELIAIAEFSIREENEWLPSSQTIRVISNTIFLTVK